MTLVLALPVCPSCMIMHDPLILYQKFVFLAVLSTWISALIGRLCDVATSDKVKTLMRL